LNTVVIIGASGYIGKHLLKRLPGHDDVHIKVLSRSLQNDNKFGSGVEIIKGDLRSLDSLSGIFEMGCTVINLAYLWEAGEKTNLLATRNLLEACKVAKIGCLIHCSTAAVVGRASDNLVTETTPCLPITEYGITKLKIEQMILESVKDNFNAVIIRPTSVFGINGLPLSKLAQDLIFGNKLLNYLKSSLFGRRRMNLVNVDNVVAAIIFLMQQSSNINGEIFIISDDDNPINNFEDVEEYLMKAFCIPAYRLPRLKLPLGLLQSALKILGRNNVNPRCNYAQDKLLALSFKRSISFDASLEQYVSWYRSEYLEN